MEILAAIVGGSFGAAIVSLIQYLIGRHDKKKAGDSSERKALRYLMLYIIQERCKEIIARNWTTLEERRSLGHWHDVYHNGLGGNGDADALMQQVKALPLRFDELGVQYGPVAQETARRVVTPCGGGD